MENEISNDYIDNAIDELSIFFGVKEPISGEKIFSLIRSNKIKDAMKLIAMQLDLPIDINIINVPDNYKEQNHNNQFQSTHLVKSHPRKNGGSGIIAQVSIPGNLPLYGSSTLNNYPIDVKISHNCTTEPVVFCTIMAHEFSHVLLYSLNHSQKENEFYTDLTAIMLGFQNIYQNGRKITQTTEEYGVMSVKTKTCTTTYGYLDDNQFEFARNKINLILSKSREKKDKLYNILKKQNKELNKLKRNLFKFKMYTKFLCKNTNKKINIDDGKKITYFFQPNYLTEKEELINKNIGKNKIAKEYLKTHTHYTEQKNKVVSKNRVETKKYIKEIKTVSKKIKKDTLIMKKYINIKYKVKTILLYYFNKIKI